MAEMAVEKAEETTPVLSIYTEPFPIKFDGGDEFRRALRKRIDDYFVHTGRKKRDCPEMYAKGAILFGVMVLLYVLLVFVAWTWWMAIPLAILLGLAMAAVGFNVQHDGGHRAYSERAWVNKLSALTLDFLGASSYIWARKHNSIHHSYTNITGHDDDINVGFLGRLSPHQPRHRFHRLQHIYLWVLYGLLPIKWHFVDDFRNLYNGHLGGHRLPRPKGWDLVTFVAGKVVFFSWAFAIPLMFHSWWLVASIYALAAFAEGIALSVVFQMAHCVEEAEFPMPEAETGRIEHSWAAHQVETTVDFAPRSRIVTWLIGGLNCQVEHHLFPQICHIHYPALSPIVQQVCKEFGLRYRANATFFEGVVSHFRWLRRMGMPETA